MNDEIEVLFKDAIRCFRCTPVVSTVAHSDAGQFQNVSIILGIFWQTGMIRSGPMVTRIVSAGAGTTDINGISDVNRILRHFDADTRYDGS